MRSIIVPVYNQHHFTDICIEAVYENTSDYELIIIDNGSTPPYKPPLVEMVPYSVTLIRNENNEGFPKAVNQGIRAAKGETIILLNNDVIVTEGWADTLEGWLDEGYSIISPVTNYVAGLQRVMLPDGYESINEMIEKSSDYMNENAGVAEDVNFVIGFCMAFKKKLYDELGEFDESLWPCSGEEIDFCFRARELGHSVAIARDCYVHHEGSMTFKDMEQKGMLTYQTVCNRNDEHLEKRWGRGFWQRQSIEKLQFTGERAMPLYIGMPQDCMNEHWERYKFACDYIRDKAVLDIACGAGYGSDLLAQYAGSVIGGDISIDAIEYCIEHYNRENLFFRNVDARNMPFGDDSFDVIVSFETIEHFHSGELFLLEAVRVLKSDGILIISTPLGGPDENPFHIVNFQRPEIEKLLTECFSGVEFYYQKKGHGIRNFTTAPDYFHTSTDEFVIAVCIGPKKGLSFEYFPKHSEKLAIGVPCSFPTVPVSFFYSFVMMEKPDFFFIHADNGPIDTLRNDIVKKAKEMGATRLLMLDVDMIYHPDTVSRLLSHDLPIVSAVCFRRYPPFDPIMLRVGEDRYDDIEDWEDGDLVEVDATGTGCIMYDMRIFDKMPEPWFRFQKDESTGATIGEDIGFCQDLKAAGYRIFVDTSIPCDHLTTMAVNKKTWLLYRSMKEKQHKMALEKALGAREV